MPLLEVIQSRLMSASVRLDEATAIQVDQYAASLRHLPTMWWIKRSTMYLQKIAIFRTF
jgi:hypothetical protein